MAEVSESLQYRFEESGLDDLRRDMKRLSGDVEDLGDEFSQLGTEAEGGTEAAEEAVEDLQRTVARIDFDELGDEAMGAADEVALAASVMEEELEGVQEALDDISTLGARRQMRRLGQEVENVMLRTQALDAQDIDIDADVDRDRSFGGGPGGSRVRLPGELDEVQEGFFAFRSIPPQIQALGAAAVAATAALGAGAGLAGVATRLAAELGPQGLQNEVKALQSSFRESGQQFASAFSGVIRSEVIPAAKGLALAIRGVDDSLAAFSGFMLDVLKAPGPLAPVGGVIQGLQAAGAANQDVSNTDALDEGVGDVKGITDIFPKLRTQISRARTRFQKGLIPREELLSQIESFRLNAFKQLQKLKGAVPGVFPPGLLDAQAAKLRKIKQRLKEIQQVSLEGVAVQPADAEQVETAGPEKLPTGSITENIPQRIQGPSPKQIRAIVRAMRQANVEAQRFKRAVKRGLKSAGVRALAQSFSTLGSAIAGAKDTMEKMKRITTSLLKSVGSLLLRFAILGSGGAGAGLLGGLGLVGSGILGSLDSGGKILSDGIAKVHEGEAVIPADITRSLEALVQPAQPTAQPAAMAGAGGVNLTVQVEGESRIENGHIKRAYDTATQVEQRVGRRGR